MAKTKSILSADIVQALRNRANRVKRTQPLIPWWLTIAVWALIALMIASPMMGCAHAPKVAPAFGFQAKQCKVRTVICVPDKDMSEEWCSVHARHSIEAINEAVGAVVLRFGGSIEADPDAVVAAAKKGAIPVWTEKLPPNVLGMTSYNFETETACMGITIVRLSLELQAPHGSWAHYAQGCLTHELIHALGGGHADVGAFPTIMAPGANMPNSSLEITPFDRAALRAAY
jgi:hypothetical protein